MFNKLIDVVEQPFLKAERPEIPIGATVDVHTRIIEGDKERVQVFTGVVIARRGRGNSETVTVRRIVANEGVERIFMIHSPRVVKIEVRRLGKSRRAKLYYLRDRVGKSRKLREKRATPAKGTAGPSDKNRAKDSLGRSVGTETEPVEAVGHTA